MHSSRLGSSRGPSVIMLSLTHWQRVSKKAGGDVPNHRDVGATQVPLVPESGWPLPRPPHARSNVQRDHLPPVGGPMDAALPDVKGVPRPFLPERRTDLMVALAEGVFLADGQDDLQASNRVEMPGVVQVREEVARRVQVDGLVVVAVEQVTEVVDRAGQVVAAAECNELAEPMGVSEDDVGRMIGPEAAAERSHEVTGVDPAAEAQDLVQDVPLVQLVMGDPLPRVQPPAVKGHGVDTVEAEELDPALIDVSLQGGDDPPVLVVEEATASGRKGQHPGP